MARISNRLAIEYHIRIRDNFWVEKPASGQRIKASWLFNALRINESTFHRKIVRVNGELCYLSASRIIIKEKVPELQIIVSFKKPDYAQEAYKERWQIETAFYGKLCISSSNGLNSIFILKPFTEQARMQFIVRSGLQSVHTC